ncbi:alpha-L-rhamnosidase [Rathayibacter sp. PhB127]|uniref:family 78 glycoside hydrolase catalytic domain n=1 Tax=Rathayibacter sp. PhB127 TaxID=2485176 RepID=UPI000F913F3F|nr:family 78 glycoside hydrolase catalytic domain [Rathayibacter sp. PhB127]ROS21578.1 alpha-L-rhamnosidase [Rathayibacter sp. PhB127]
MTAERTTAYGLRASGLVDPLGVAVAAPVLSWGIRGDRPPERFVVEGASSRAALERDRADRFSVEVAAAEGTLLRWPAAPLASRERVWWRVGVVVGGAIEWSASASLEAPLWSAEEWGAEAISHAAWAAGDTAGAFPELEQRFSLGVPVLRARLYLTAAGVVVPTLNGAAAIRGQLEPGYSDLATGVPAAAWDVAASLSPGENVLRFALGGGIAHVPRLPGRYTKFAAERSVPWVRARLEIVGHDESVTVITTDAGWRARLGRTTVAHWYGGEDVGSRPAGEWGPAAVVPDAVDPWWRSAPPIVVTETLAPVDVRRVADVRVVDFGVNAAGRPRLRTASLPDGAEIRLAPSELLDDAGRADQSTTGGPIRDTFSGSAVDPDGTDWAPSFVYHGGRYLEVSGLPATAPDPQIGFEVLRAENRRVGEFSSSDPFLHDLHRIVDRAIQSNMYSVFTDCPHREKLGWVEQLSLVFGGLARGYDVQAHLSDAVRHMLEAQTPSGLVPSTVPELVVFDTFGSRGDATAFRDDPNWGRSIIDVPWKLYRHYGDDAAIRVALPAMRRYLQHLAARAENGVLDIGLGDWIEIDTSTPRAFVATHAWAEALRTAARCAAVNGEDALAEKWSRHATRLWDGVRKTFRDRRTGIWGSGSQASWALASTVAGLEEHERRRIVRELVARIHADGDTVTVGEIGLSPLIRTLTDSGRADLLHRMLRRPDAPGYGHQLATGATALTESWQGPTGPEGVASQNHFMLGAVDEWLLGDVAGLRQAPESIGWRSVVVDPHLLEGIDDARTVFESPAGRFEVAWRRGRGSALPVLEVSAPPHVAVEIRESARFEVVLRRA